MPVAEVEKSLWKVDEPLARRLFVKRLVVEAEPVTRRVVAVVEARVDDAFAINPLSKDRVVEVEFSPEPRVVNGNAKPLPPGQEVLQSVPTHITSDENTDEEALVKFCKADQL